MARARGRTSRPDYSWTNFGDVEKTQAIGGDAVLGSSVSVVNTPQTLIRIRGKVGCYLDAGAGNEDVMILCGVCILSPDAVAAPEIFTGALDEGRWIWQGALYVASGAGIAAGAEESQFDSLDVDSKAMKRLKPNDQVVFVHHSPVALATDQSGTYDITWYLHCLIQS